MRDRLLAHTPAQSHLAHAADEVGRSCFRLATASAEDKACSCCLNPGAVRKQSGHPAGASSSALKVLRPRCSSFIPFSEEARVLYSWGCCKGDG